MPRLVPLTALFLAATISLQADGAEISIEKAEFGLAGAYRAGQWTPLAIHLTDDSAPPSSIVIETVTTDPDGASVVRIGSSQSTEAGSSHTVRAVFQSGRLGSDLTVRLRSSSGEFLTEHRYRYGGGTLREALPKGTTLWATAGFGSSDDQSIPPSPPVPEGVVAARLGNDVPIDRLAFTAADLLFVRGDLAVTPQQAIAIRDWVAGGGHLAIALGDHTEEFQAGPLAEWVPIDIVGEMQLFDLTQVEIYSRSNRPRKRARRVPAARLTGAIETLLPDDPNGDLIVRSPYGFGRVTVFAFDVDTPPFAGWEGLPAVLSRALLEREAATERAQQTAVGVTDLATQMLRAQEAVFSVDRPSTGRALLLLLAFAAIVGPVDYLVVHRLLRRPALTWVTFPLIVFAAAAWLDRSAIASNGVSSELNRIDLFDVDEETGTVRGRTSVALYSASSTRGEVTVRPPIDGSETGNQTPAVQHLAWSAPAEDSFGGTFREASGGLIRSEYLLPPPGIEAKVERLPLLVGASRHLTTVWQNNDADLVESQLAARGRGILEGQAIHRLPGSLTDYIVAFGDRIYVPREPEWHPGESIDLGSSAFLRQDLGSFLTRAQTKQVAKKPGEAGETFVVTEGTYDPLSTNLDDIVRMLTFHAAAGGHGYTGLTNVVRPTDDLTPLLRLGRAIVVGRLDISAADIDIAAESGPTFENGGRTIFVRFVLVPERAENDRRMPLAPAKP